MQITLQAKTERFCKKLNKDSSVTGKEEFFK
jgi:hypothetical protein